MDQIKDISYNLQLINVYKNIVLQDILKKRIILVLNVQLVMGIGKLFRLLLLVVQLVIQIAQNVLQEVIQTV